MKTCLILLLISTIISSCASRKLNKNELLRQPQSELSQSPVFFEKIKIKNLTDYQRAGFLLEAKNSEFKGCLIYLQGLGDSIQNHYPLFNKLSKAGYRVLVFDYLGQGESEGSMAKTRINSKGDPFPKNDDYEIGVQAKFIWERYSANSDPIYGRNCAQSKKRVIGWSTGGLAAYKLANEGWASEVALVAPGIVPNICVGEAGKSSLIQCTAKNLSLDHIITLRTLTSNSYANTLNPHFESIKPSRFLEIKEFAINLVSTAYLQARFWKIHPIVKGIVFLSGEEDTYVNRDKTNSILKKNASHFKIIKYDGALHEIDNEIPQIANDMHEKTIQFFNSN